MRPPPGGRAGFPSALDPRDPRIRLRNRRPLHPEGSCVVYWMQRAQRAADNPALNAAINAANELGKPLVVFFRLVPDFVRANERHYAFMIRGLAETGPAIEKRGGLFVMRLSTRDDPVAFCREVGAALLVGDENPLRQPEKWRRETARRLPVLFATVDADVVVPTSLFPREEYAARTLRPKIRPHLEDFLAPEREPRVRVPFAAGGGIRSEPLVPDVLLRRLHLAGGAGPVGGIKPGTGEGMRILKTFIRRGLNDYPDRRNRPEDPRGTSGLSPYLHFGQLGPRGIARAVLRSEAPLEAREALLEQLIVRRELAVNFVARNAAYDRYEGLPAWGRATLRRHARDRRPYVYTERQLEAAETHDPLWNAAQQEMVRTGFMHGYLRMYWAKKILEWTEDPEEAFETAVRLNDRYLLDGRDPNGYANIAWAIGGKHDRPWPERKVFGTIRYMSFASTSRKFDSAGYIRRIEEAAG